MLLFLGRTAANKQNNAPLESPRRALQIKQRLQLLVAVLRVLHTMPHRPLVRVNLIIVPALERLVAKEVDGRVVHPARQVLLILNVLQTVRLVPPLREDIEGDLPADRVPAKPNQTTSARPSSQRTYLAEEGLHT